MHRNVVLKLGPLLAAALALAAARPLAAQSLQSWTVLPLGSRGVDPGVVETFSALLRTELAQRLSAHIVAAPQSQPCADTACAAQAGRAAGARFVLWGEVSALGTKIVVNLSVADAARGAPLSAQRMSVTRVEELDAVAARVVSAIGQGTTTEATAELGTITSQEVQPDRRREGARGVAFRVGAVVPLGESYNRDGGVLFDLSYWFETRHFAIEPRVGVRFDGASGEAGYAEVPLDIGVYYLLSTADIAPFVGGGIGARYLWERRPETVRVGDVLPATTEMIVEDDAWGFGAYARIGVMLLRTYTLRMGLSAEYNILIAEVNNSGFPQSLTIGASLIF